MRNVLRSVIFTAGLLSATAYAADTPDKSSGLSSRMGTPGLKPSRKARARSS